MRLEFQKTIRSQEKSENTVKDEDLSEGVERKSGCSGEKRGSMLSAVRKEEKLAISGLKEMIQRKPEKKCLRGAQG